MTDTLDFKQQRLIDELVAVWREQDACEEMGADWNCCEDRAWSIIDKLNEVRTQLGLGPVDHGALYRSRVASHESSRVIVQDVQRELLRLVQNDPKHLFTLAPRKFEELVAFIYSQHGFDVTLTPETRDGGIDIIAVRHELLTDATTYLIECKRYQAKRKVGIGIVQRMLGVVEAHHAHRGIIVTTSSFSSDALAIASTHRHALSLKDYKAITDWLKHPFEKPA